MKNQAIEEMKATDTFKQGAIWSEVSNTAYRVGGKGFANDYLGNAIPVVSVMQTQNCLARALSRIANSVISSESASGGR